MIGAAHGNLSGKHLVIFGCGYVGSHLARQAVARGARVTALTRNQDKAAVLGTIGIEVIVADLADFAWHRQVGPGVTWAVNCVSSGGGGLDGYRRSYVDGTSSVMAWARASGGVETLIYTSSTSVYPQGQGARVDEDAPTEGAGERAQLLLAAESMVKAGPEAGACRWATILRLAGIYGPGRHHLLDQVRTGIVAGRGDFHLNLIHRDDICAAIWATLRVTARQGIEVLNLADDGAATKSAIVAWLADRLGVPLPVFSGEPVEGRRQVTPDRVIVNTRAKAALGWTPIFPTFRQGYENLLSQSPTVTLSTPLDR